MMIWTVGIALASAALREEAVAVAVSAVGELEAPIQIKAAPPTANLQTEQKAHQQIREAPLAMACADPLVGTATISASTSSPTMGPLQSLNDEDLDHAWKPSVDTQNQWIEWSWTDPKEIHYIQTSGLRDYMAEGGVTEFKVQYATHDGNLQYYVSAADYDGGKSWTVLHGAANAAEPKFNTFDPPIKTLLLKVIATKWERHIALRGSIRGCPMSDVVRAQLKLQASYTTLVPHEFETNHQLAHELRVRVADELACPLDMITVTEIKPAVEPDQTELTVGILPKPGQAPPSEWIEKLGAAISNENGELFKWMADIEKTTEIQAKTCLAVDCHDHGQCAGGKCFCLQGYSGDDCNTKDGQRDTSHLANAAAGEANAANQQLEPLPVFTKQPLLPLHYGASKPSEKELEEQIEAVNAQVAEDTLEDEPGASGVIRRHKSLLIAPLLLVFFCLVYAASMTQVKKKEKLLEAGDEEEVGDDE